MFENYHDLLDCLSTLKIASLEQEKRDVKTRYSNNLESYVTGLLGRPLEKLSVSCFDHPLSFVFIWNAAHLATTCCSHSATLDRVACVLELRRSEWWRRRRWRAEKQMYGRDSGPEHSTTIFWNGFRALCTRRASFVVKHTRVLPGWNEALQSRHASLIGLTSYQWFSKWGPRRNFRNRVTTDILWMYVSCAALITLFVLAPQITSNKVSLAASSYHTQSTVEL